MISSTIEVLPDVAAVDLAKSQLERYVARDKFAQQPWAGNMSSRRRVNVFEYLI